MAQQRPKTASVKTGLSGFWSRLRERFSLPGLEAWSTTMRTVFLNALFLVAIIVVFPVLISQFRRDQVVIEPIAVPEALATQGMTSDVAANRIWDGLQDTVAQSRTSKESVVAIPDSRRVEFSFPDSGFSMESLVFHVRRLFNAYETRIAGEFVCGDADCKRAGMRLRLRVIRDGVEIIDMPPLGERPERDYFADAGSRVLAILDPFVALSAAASTQPLKATTLARRLIRAHHKDAKWAHNLVGLIRYNAGDLEAAKADLEAAVAIDPGFVPALSNLGNVLIKMGDLPGAEAKFKEIASRDQNSVLAAEGFAELALARGDKAGAVSHLLEAAERDPVNPRYFAKAGKIELDAGRKAEGIKLLSRSLELDPGYLPAFAYLAAMHLGDGDNVAAEKIYRDAADYSPNDADAQGSHGRMLAILHQWDGAADRFSRAIAIDASNVYYRIELARCLQRLGRHADAIAALDASFKLAPGNADIFMVYGESYRETGRKPEAIAAYAKYLELDKSDSPLRFVAQRYIEILSGKT